MQVPCKEQKFCSDCKHSKIDKSAGFIFYECLVEFQNRVTGKYEKDGCQTRRGDKGFCGVEAKYFEPKDD